MMFIFEGLNFVRFGYECLPRTGFVMQVTSWDTSMFQLLHLFSCSRYVRWPPWNYSAFCTARLARVMRLFASASIPMKRPNQPQRLAPTAGLVAFPPGASACPGLPAQATGFRNRPPRRTCQWRVDDDSDNYSVDGVTLTTNVVRTMEMRNPQNIKS